MARGIVKYIILISAAIAVKISTIMIDKKYLSFKRFSKYSFDKMKVQKRLNTNNSPLLVNEPPIISPFIPKTKY
ncbi:hypothetical protein I080019B2_30370 [Bacteroides stercoris]